jgi:hypothetical protein
MRFRLIKLAATWGGRKRSQIVERTVSKVVMYASVSVDGYIADDNDDPGPLFDWLVNGDVPLDDSGALKVSQPSSAYIRPYWDGIGATRCGWILPRSWSTPARATSGRSTPSTCWRTRSR